MRKKSDSNRVLQWIITVFSLLLGSFMVTLELGVIDGLWRLNANVVYRLVSVFYFFYFPWLLYALFGLVDIIVEKKRGSATKLRYYMGLPLAILFCGVLISGVVNRHHLEVEHVVVESSTLPKQFDGKKVVVLADAHLGTLLGNQRHYLESVVDQVNMLKPDFIFFVGDLVNAYANEASGPNHVLTLMHAMVGKYAVMGNHDYGDYFPFEDAAEYEANLVRMKDMYESCGFHLLCNEGVTISYDSVNTINILGIENWGTGRFPKHGDLQKAYNTVNAAPFNILLSHDPNSWHPLVLDNDYPIDLTLSGHTHASQIKIGEFTPSQFQYPYNSGLYEENGKYLYVTRGIGYVVMPMRIGKGPEITEITLKCVDKSPMR
ncbi:MAG: metallophosphoesterase [Bacteroidales bacterium]|nr:metallophosphoesterase [Bacteroidales bacterium]